MTIPRAKKQKALAQSTDFLRYWREPDWENLDPVLYPARTISERRLTEWWIGVISSEEQKSHPGRNLSFYLLDRESKCFLGAFRFGDSQFVSWRFRDDYLGITSEQARRNWGNLVYLQRCLPVAPFGGLLGGKLLAMLAVSREVIRIYEMRFSLRAAGLWIRTLHGESSQYNRLDGFDYIGTDPTGKGAYVVELRKKGFRWLRGEVDYSKTRPKTITVAETSALWRERWYEPRLKSQGPPKWDQEMYRVHARLEGN